MSASLPASSPGSVPSRLDFIVVDFETANADPASVCQVGVASVRAGRIQSTQSWLVVPPTGLDSFSSFNISIHGIRPAAIRKRGGLNWEDLHARLNSVGQDLPFVAHNARFDEGVYRAASAHVGITAASRQWFDSLEFARGAFPDFANHKLDYLAQRLGLNLERHHDAESDAVAAAELVLRIVEQTGAQSLPELRRRLGGRRRVVSGSAGAAGSASSPRAGGSADWGYSPRVSELPRPATDADPAHPLYGQFVTITGNLPVIGRKKAYEAIAAAGATIQNNVTKKTTMLVIAGVGTIPKDYDPEVGSAKERLAHRYASSGQEIALIAGAQLEVWLAVEADFAAADSPQVPILVDSEPVRTDKPFVEAQPPSPFSQSTGANSTLIGISNPSEATLAAVPVVPEKPQGEGVTAPAVFAAPESKPKEARSRFGLGITLLAISAIMMLGLIGSLPEQFSSNPEQSVASQVFGCAIVFAVLVLIALYGRRLVRASDTWKRWRR